MDKHDAGVSWFFVAAANAIKAFFNASIGCSFELIGKGTVSSWRMECRHFRG